MATHPHSVGAAAVTTTTLCGSYGPPPLTTTTPHALMRPMVTTNRPCTHPLPISWCMVHLQPPTPYHHGPEGHLACNERAAHEETTPVTKRIRFMHTKTSPTRYCTALGGSMVCVCHKTASMPGRPKEQRAFDRSLAKGGAGPYGCGNENARKCTKKNCP